MTTGFVEELEQLRLQVEVLTLLVDEAIGKTMRLIEADDSQVAADLAADLFRSDNEIDAMQVSLTERCYELLMRQALMASDLRLVVSVIRVLGSLERMGDLCLRIAGQVDSIDLVRAQPSVYRIIRELADNVQQRYWVVQRAWSSSDLGELDSAGDHKSLEEFGQLLIERILELEGADAVRVSMAAFVIGRSLDRIGDHTHVVETRLRYLITGDHLYLADEIAE